MAGLHDYYSTQAIRPTHADFSSDTELSRYETLRKNAFYRLMFPPALFSGKTVLEFGPDTGENSLIFALWGAQLTLVEPNQAAHAYIRSYFAKFGQQSQLGALVAASLLEYTPDKKYDIIDAEGFIYTVQPTSAWVQKTAECLAPEGFLIISYTTPHGGYIELLTKAIYQRVASLCGEGLETAEKIFTPRWNTIQHTRKFASWFMDVIKNPFVRNQYFIDPAELLKQMHDGGFRLYSSWPNYRDTLAMQWLKAPYDQQAEMQASLAFVEQSRLSHLLGRQCFIPKISSVLSGQLTKLVQLTDGLIDDSSAWSEALACVERIADLLRNTPGVDYASACEILDMSQSIFQLIGLAQPDRLIEFCRTDPVFLKTWGMPNHYAIFQLHR